MTSAKERAVEAGEALDDLMFDHEHLKQQAEAFRRHAHAEMREARFARIQQMAEAE